MFGEQGGASCPLERSAHWSASLLDLGEYRFAPRLRDLAERRLGAIESPSTYKGQGTTIAARSGPTPLRRVLLR